jgi:hypothetical protein
MVEITLFRKAGGPLTKKIVLAPNGSLHSDSSACVMSYGTAWRCGVSRLGELAELIDRFGPDQALALGRLRSDLPAPVEVTTKRKLDGGAAPNLTCERWRHFAASPPHRTGPGAIIQMARRERPGFVAPSEYARHAQHEVNLDAFEARHPPPGDDAQSNGQDLADAGTVIPIVEVNRGDS